MQVQRLTLRLVNFLGSIHFRSVIVLAAQLSLLISFSSKYAVAFEQLTDIQREIRTDTVEEKLELIQKAYEAGRFDMALSLAESLKDTVQCEKQLRSDPGKPDFEIESPTRVSDLPAPWGEWAQGWQYAQILKLAEPSGMARSQEPIDLLFAFNHELVGDLHREIRVAQIDEATGALHEIPSQVYNARHRGDKNTCRLVFFADVPADGKTNVCVFFGNPLAEQPKYATDLKVDGENYGLDISNSHYVAKLSRQTGQLERLHYARQHGLELFSGGKGHGEPPTIDWSNDYVDQEHFQKLRIRNWPEPPNYEIVRGPLMVRVRRWGFPHSPIHPVFTPSRLHIDQTYVFYAGKDYFIKEGITEAAKDFDYTTMRDDEWVLSGYSFTDKVWIDGEGHLREGDVPGDEIDSLRGVGFHHNQSRDAFIALWLEHSSHGFEGLVRAGPPTLHYHQHGQLWSRYPLGSGSLSLKQGMAIHQKNAYSVAPYPEQDAASVVEGLQNRLLQPLNVSESGVPKSIDPTADGKLAHEGETPESATLKPALWEALRKVKDEQLYRIDANVVDMGLIYDLKVHEGVVEVLMTMPNRGRPVYQFFVTQGGGHTSEGIRERLLEVEGVKQVLVNFTWYPAWTVDRLSKAGRLSLGLPSE